MLATDEYRSRVAPTVEKFGGQYLVRGGPFEVVEGTDLRCGAKNDVAAHTELTQQRRNHHASVTQTTGIR